MIAGGSGANRDVESSAELYTPSTLNPAGLIAITLRPASPTVVVGETQPFTAIGTVNGPQTPASVGRVDQTPTLLEQRMVLIEGGSATHITEVGVKPLPSGIGI
ncbi:MAG: hypothetical protein WCA20_26190 [Candidatus Sulfotelmatobacter sp.]